jgi:predicted nuclease of predicted toxin-antitoxin system
LKLLFDENLSPRLVRELADLFPDSDHVGNRGLARATDVDIWAHARTHAFTIVTKDDDFESLAFVYGAPPKVIWIRAGNVSTAEILARLRASSVAISDFGIAADEALLVL